MIENVKDVVALPQDEVPIPETVQALMIAASDEMGDRLHKLFTDLEEETKRLELADEYAKNLILSGGAHVAAVISVGVLGKAMSLKGWPYMMAWQTMVVDIQQRMQNVIKQLSVPITPGNETVN